jgi:Tol biopolymer transport system component
VIKDLREVHVRIHLRFFQGFLGMAVLTGLLAACAVDPKTMDTLKAFQKKSAPAVDLSQYMKDVTDNARVAYVAMIDNKAQIFTVLPDGTQPQQMTTDPGYKCHPSWSLNHKLLAYFRFKSDRPLNEPVSVMIISTDNPQPKEILGDKRIDVRTSRINWNAASTVFYISEQDFPGILFGYDASTGKPVDTIRLPKKTFLNRIYSISRDGQRLAGDGPSKDEKNVLHLGVVDRDGANEFDPLKLFVKGACHYGVPVWSNNAKMMAFDFDTTIIAMSTAFAMGFKVYPIAPQDFDAQMSSPSFSPTGAMLTCIMEKTKEGHVGSGDSEVNTDVWVMQVNGSKQKKITDTGSCFDPCW